jgi:hypothetical protein
MPGDEGEQADPTGQVRARLQLTWEALAWTLTRMATMRKCGIGSSHHCTNALPLGECSG